MNFQQGEVLTLTIRAVFFDLDDTLLWDERSVEETFAHVCAYASSRCGVDPHRLEAAVREQARKLYASYETYPFTQNIGINPFEGLWADFRLGDNPNFRKLQQLAPEYRRSAWTMGLKETGIDNPELGAELGQLFYEERRKRPYVYDETFDILKQLKDRYILLLLTNGSPDLQQEKLDGVPELASYFHHIIISGNFGQGKPSPELFAHALERAGVAPHEAIMVGDKLTTDILGANRSGLHSVWINRRGMERGDDIVPAYEITNLMEIPDVIRKIDANA
jgi:putative hydrolase of the HAD superfamily